MRLTELVTPLKPLEAMAQGRVLVASDVGGHRELIRDGRPACCSRPATAPALAAADRCGLLAERGTLAGAARRGRRFVERERNWTASVQRYADVYARLASNRRNAVAA